MGRINIEIPDPLHKELKHESVDRELDLKDTIIEVLGDGLGVEGEEYTFLEEQADEENAETGLGGS